jgi:hypothetical protein
MTPTATGPSCQINYLKQRDFLGNVDRSNHHLPSAGLGRVSSQDRKAILFHSGVLGTPKSGVSKLIILKPGQSTPEGNLIYFDWL